MNFNLQNHMAEIQRRERLERRKEYRRAVGLMLVIISAIVALMLSGHVAERIAEARAAPAEFLERY